MKSAGQHLRDLRKVSVTALQIHLSRSCEKDMCIQLRVHVFTFDSRGKVKFHIGVRNSIDDMSPYQIVRLSSAFTRVAQARDSKVTKKKKKKKTSCCCPSL